MNDKKLVLTTTGSQEEAQKIAHALVDRRLAACVNIIPQIQSIYRWKEKVEEAKVEEAKEWLLVIKTTADAFDRVRNAIKEMHSYELPECICLGIEDGSAEYLKWIEDGVE